MKCKTILIAAFSICTLLMSSSAMANDTEISFDEQPDPQLKQTISLWEPDNIPAETIWNNSGSDPEDFMPNMISVPAAEGVPVKGAVMINPGGAFAFRSPAEGLPVAEELSKLGYQCFVVNYRLRPYTQEEAALDLARGIRYVRSHASDYGIEPNDIATIGFSAGGILSGELALNFNGLVNGTALDEEYIPDALDNISADVAAIGLMYSFYGRLSVASTDVEKFRQSNLPPTYVLYGSNEVFRGQIENQVALLEEAGVFVERRMLDGYSHGFGASGNWFDEFDKFLSGVFQSNAEDADILNVAEPVIENDTLKFSMTANRDVSALNIITALYSGGILENVRVNDLDGTFLLNPDKTYMMKVFVWQKGTMQPMTDSYVFRNLRTNRSGFQVMLNNTLSGKEGNIHYTYYLPADYDESKSYPMLMTLPGWSNRFNTIEITPLTENRYALQNAEAWTALAGDMIIVSPNLTDWGDKSARQTLELTDYFIENFSVDEDKIYAAGFSAGGETLSRAINMRPELFAAYLHSASQWNGGYEKAARSRIPIYICMAQNDEYYGAQTAQTAYDGLKQAYQAAGVSDKEIEELLVLDLKENAYFDGIFSGNYHGGGSLFACDPAIINWLLDKA